MSFSRLRYDECATKLHNQRSVGVGEYRLFPGYVENCEQCYSLTGPVGSKADVSTAKNKVINKKVCSPMLNAEDTRFTNPVQSYRSMSLTSYQLQPWLFSNPQCHVQDDRIGLGSRNTAKDAYKMPLPEFLDKGAALPKPIKPSRMCTQ